MQERQRDRVRPQPSGPAGGLFDNPGDARGIATVSHGVYAEDLPVAGLTAGEVRQRFRERFDIHPGAVALIDGRQVDADTRIRSGQLLSFVRPSGEKGVIPPLRRRRGGGRRRPGATVTLEGEKARAALPEGDTAEVPVGELLGRLGGALPDTRDVVLPEGVKCLLPMPNGFVAVHQTPPRVYNLRWLAKGSPADYGPGAEYRQVRVALPYVIVLAVFQSLRRDVPRLEGHHECFFRNRGLEAQGLDSELCYPALLNCSRFPPGPKYPLSWICTQHLPPGRRPATLDQSLREGLRGLLHHLFEAGFNLSSERHEGSSWFSETVKAQVDPRLASVEDWERATEEDPLFVLEVPWLPTGLSLRKVADRIAGNHAGNAVQSADDVARLIFHMDATAREVENEEAVEEGK